MGVRESPPQFPANLNDIGSRTASNYAHLPWKFAYTLSPRSSFRSTINLTHVSDSFPFGIDVYAKITNYMRIDFSIILCAYTRNNQSERFSSIYVPSVAASVLWPGDETRGFSTNENKIPSLWPYARRTRAKAASPATQVVPTIIVTIILVLVTRKPWNTKQPCLIHRPIGCVSVPYYPTYRYNPNLPRGSVQRVVGKWRERERRRDR